MSSKLLFPSTPYFQNKRYFTQLLYLLLFTLGGAIIFSALSILLTQLFWGADHATHTTAGSYRFMQGLSAVGAFLLPALLFSYCKQKHAFTYADADHLPCRPIFFAYAFILSCSLLPLTAALVYCNSLIPLPAHLAQLFQSLEDSNNQVLEIILSDSSWGGFLLNLLICAVLPAICEEFFFRGTVQSLLHDWFKNKHAAIWVTAFIFSAIHFQFSGFLARMALGAYLGYLFVWSRSLWVPIVAHFLNNAYSVVYAFIDPSSIHEDADFIFQEGINSPAAALSLIFTLVLSAIFLYYAYQKREQEHS